MGQEEKREANADIFLADIFPRSESNGATLPQSWPLALRFIFQDGSTVLIQTHNTVSKLDLDLPLIPRSSSARVSAGPLKIGA